MHVHWRRWAKITLSVSECRRRPHLRRRRRRTHLPHERTSERRWLRPGQRWRSVPALPSLCCLGLHRMAQQRLQGKLDLSPEIHRTNMEILQEAHTAGLLQARRRQGLLGQGGEEAEAEPHEFWRRLCLAVVDPQQQSLRQAPNTGKCFQRDQTAVHLRGQRSQGAVSHFAQTAAQLGGQLLAHCRRRGRWRPALTWRRGRLPRGCHCLHQHPA
mmetsp:Transcript_53470/g.173979  ORF Transcript_53470/g.173979 Transcript_53470/m.173979 type:complete len:214 (-) Transcript_53470:115-756(-)